VGVDDPEVWHMPHFPRFLEQAHLLPSAATVFLHLFRISKERQVKEIK
jgi:hypothetical protein